MNAAAMLLRGRARELEQRTLVPDYPNGTNIGGPCGVRALEKHTDEDLAQLYDQAADALERVAELEAEQRTTLLVAFMAAAAFLDLVLRLLP